MQAVADPGDADDHPALVDEGRHVRADPSRTHDASPADWVVGGQLLAVLGHPRVVLDQRHLPDEPSSLLIERDQARVYGGLVDQAVRHGHAAIGRAAAHRRAAPLVLVPPLLASRARVNRHDVIEGERYVHHAVGDDRGRLEGRRHTALVDPARRQPRHVRRVDAGQWGEALVAIVAAVGEPAGRIGGRGQQARVVDVRRQRDRAHQQSERPDYDPPDHVPFLLYEIFALSSAGSAPRAIAAAAPCGRRAPWRRLADPDPGSVRPVPWAVQISFQIPATSDTLLWRPLRSLWRLNTKPSRTYTIGSYPSAARRAARCRRS